MSLQSDARQKEELDSLFGTSKYVIGMVHLLPLPGAPRWTGQMADVLERAVDDAHRPSPDQHQTKDVCPDEV